MPESNHVERLRQIADEIQGLPDDLASFMPGELAAAGGALLAEALSLGAFAGRDHTRLRNLIHHQQRSYPSDWQWGAWDEAVSCLAGKSGIDAWRKSCGAIAEAVRAEAVKVGAAEQPKPNRPGRPPATAAQRKEERRICDDYEAAGNGMTYAEFGRIRGMEENEVRQAIERHRKRLKRMR